MGITFIYSSQSFYSMGSFPDDKILKNVARKYLSEKHDMTAEGWRCSWRGQGQITQANSAKKYSKFKCEQGNMSVLVKIDCTNYESTGHLEASEYDESED